MSYYECQGNLLINLPDQAAPPPALSSLTRANNFLTEDSCPVLIPYGEDSDVQVNGVLDLSEVLPLWPREGWLFSVIGKVNQSIGIVDCGLSSPRTIPKKLPQIIQIIQPIGQAGHPCSIITDRVKEVHMGYGLRYFVFDEEGQVTRVVNHRFRRIIRGEEAYPQAAGQQLRYAEVFLELQNRLPVAIAQANFRRLEIEEDGFHDFRKFTMLPFPQPDSVLNKRKGNIVDFKELLLKRQWERRKWTPTLKDMEAMKQKLPHLTNDSIHPE